MRQRGFTLVELMAVVLIIGVLAAVAGIKWRKQRSQNDVDRFAADCRTTILQASRRALTQRRPYMVEFKSGSVQYCEVTAANYSGPPGAVTTQTTCVGVPSGTDVGQARTPGNDAKIGYYYNGTDLAQPGSSYTAATHSALTGNAVFYFSPSGKVDANFGNVMSSLPATGLTVYLQRAGTDETNKHRKVVAYGMTGKPRIIDTW